jgi:hypothetical protein
MHSARLAPQLCTVGPEAFIHQETGTVQSLWWRQGGRSPWRLAVPIGERPRDVGLDVATFL